LPVISQSSVKTASSSLKQQYADAGTHGEIPNGVTPKSGAKLHLLQ